MKKALLYKCTTILLEGLVNTSWVQGNVILVSLYINDWKNEEGTTLQCTTILLEGLVNTSWVQGNVMLVSLYINDWANEEGTTHPLLEELPLLYGKCVRLGNDGDYVHTMMEMLHELHIHRP